MAAAVPLLVQRRESDVATMHYGCSIYGLAVLANQPIPTVPRSTITTTDVRVSFGVLPDWLDALEPHQVETTYVTDYAGACGTPALVFSRLQGGKFYLSWTTPAGRSGRNGRSHSRSKTRALTCWDR